MEKISIWGNNVPYNSKKSKLENMCIDKKAFEKEATNSEDVLSEIKRG